MVRDALAESLRDALAALGVSPVPEQVHLERPARREHGDWSTNVALAVSKAAGRKPRELAQELADRLTASPPPHVESVEIAGPGFVNFRLRPTWLHDVLREVVEQGTDAFARPDLGHGRKVNVEFVSANPTGPVHAGHARGATYGDALARLLERCGHDVHREFYINDRGVQMQAFGDSLAARKSGGEPPENGYHGQYIIDWAAEMPDGVDAFAWGYQKALDDQREVLGRLGVEYDTWFSERSLVDSGAIDETLADLRTHGVVYEADGATWLRSTDYGDDKDRVLVKSDGELTYLTPDIAYHRDKFARGADQLIDVWGADHHGYLTRMKAAYEALGGDPMHLELLIMQLVHLVRGGARAQMSKRAGEFVTLDELLAEIGTDAARWYLLARSHDTTLDLDLDLAREQSSENPVYYVQYAHARIVSVLAKAGEARVHAALQDATDRPREPLHAAERALIEQLLAFPGEVTEAAERRAPHRIAAYALELAQSFTAFYRDCRVVGAEPGSVESFRIVLCVVSRRTIARCLQLLGVSAPAQM